VTCIPIAVWATEASGDVVSPEQECSKPFAWMERQNTNKMQQANYDQVRKCRWQNAERPAYVEASNGKRTEPSFLIQEARAY